jgi:hypothetical protein
MGVYEGRGTLNKAMKQLEMRWQEVRLSWTDSRSEEFEQKILIPLQHDLRNAVAAMDHMAVVTSRIRQECE